jgi:hypothetical protein
MYSNSSNMGSVAGIINTLGGFAQILGISQRAI